MIQTRIESRLLALSFAVLTVAAISLGACGPEPTMSGSWIVDKERSSDIEPWSSVHLRITASADEVSIGWLFNPRRFTRHDSITVPTDGSQVELPMQASAKWFESPHIGVFVDGETPQQIRANWVEAGRELNIQRRMTVQTSQGATTVEIVTNYALSSDGSELTVTKKRSSRPNQLTYVYTRP